MDRVHFINELQVRLQQNPVRGLSTPVHEIAELIGSAVAEFKLAVADVEPDFLSIEETQNIDDRLAVGERLVRSAQDLARAQLDPPILGSLDAVAEAIRLLLPEVSWHAAMQVHAALDAALVALPAKVLHEFGNAHIEQTTRQGRPYKNLGFIRIAVRVSFYALCRSAGIADQDRLAREGLGVEHAGEFIRLPSSGAIKQLAALILVAMGHPENTDSIKSETNIYRKSLILESAQLGESWISPASSHFVVPGLNWNEGVPDVGSITTQT